MLTCSIIIPAFNEERFIAEAIESALSQTYKDIEVIVVDDGSTDGTADIVKKYPVRYVKHMENWGLPKARNTGIGMAMGDRILCLDGDDIITPNMVEKCIDVKGIAVVGVENFGDQGCEAKVLPYHDLTLEAFKEQNRITCCSMFNKLDWETVGGFDENLKIGKEDYEFWIKMLKAGVIMTPVNDYLFRYRIHRLEGKSMSERADDKAEEIMKYIKEKHKDIWTK